MHKTAIQRAEDARKGAELRLAIAKRTEVLVKALLKSGRAEARRRDGLQLVLQASDPSFAPHLGESTVQDNIYFTCANYACISLTE